MWRVMSLATTPVDVGIVDSVEEVIVDYAKMVWPVTDDHGKMELLEAVVALIVVKTFCPLIVDFVW